MAGWGARAPLKIVILSDIHAGAPHVSLRRLRRIVARANAEGGDLAVLLGDYAAAHPYTLGKMSKDDIIAALKGFTAPLGIYAVLGNHDWWQDSTALKEQRAPEAALALSNHDIPHLDNEAIRLRGGEEAFWLLGLADQRPLSLDPEEDGFDDLDAAMKQVTDTAPAILLAHEPDIFPDVPAQVLLTLSGHTHGGQIRILGRSPVVMVAESEIFAYGHYHHGAQSLIVSGGIGCSDYPIRLGMPPEITVVTITGPT
ncbi:metallophosphoesterase [Alphaproteobacteria bacterium KMM 3653]|uniref:Metallophosphoesterase n=2 Tax=Harenicola maris TaxID=2841044 RepID=A0AAP2G7T8_9RHOB|nr:metallophosphoesterase [Harenicola maris]